MMYNIFEFEEAIKAGCKDEEVLEAFESKWGYEYTLGIFECSDDGKPVLLIGADGGEPEDQTLGRDWNWVCGALNDAYDQGIVDTLKKHDIREDS